MSTSATVQAQADALQKVGLVVQGSSATIQALIPRMPAQDQGPAWKALIDLQLKGAAPLAAAAGKVQEVAQELGSFEAKKAEMDAERAAMNVEKAAMDARGADLDKRGHGLDDAFAALVAGSAFPH